MHGWLWKRAPRVHDTDKRQVLRMVKELVRKTPWKRRFFALDLTRKSIQYFANDTTGALLGMIDLDQLADVHTGMVDHADSETPSPHVFHVVTKKRVWSFCAETADDRDMWLEALRACLANAAGSPRMEGSKGALGSPTASSAPSGIVGGPSGAGGSRSPPLSRSASFSPRAMGATSGQPTITTTNPIASGGRGSLTEGRRKLDTRIPAGNPKNQTEYLTRLHGTYAHVSGNVPILGVSLFSENGFQDLAWYNTLRESSYGDQQAILAKLDRAINASTIQWFEEGDNLVEEASEPVAMYVVLHGSFSRSKVTRNDEKEIVSVLRRGDWFGDVEMLEEIPHLASVEALESSAVLVVPQAVFRSFIDDPELKDMRETLRYLSVRGLMTDIFKCFPKLKTLPLETLTAMSALFTLVTIPVGGKAIEEGEPATHFHVVLQGTAKVTFSCGAKTMKLSTIQAGDWVGEQELINSEKFRSTVQATTRLVLAVATADDFKKFIALGGETFERTLEANRREQIGLFISQVPLLAEFKDMHAELARLMQLVEYPAQSVICRQGTRPDGLYFLIGGTAEGTIETLGAVSLRSGEQDPPLKIWDLKEHDVFGELPPSSTGEKDGVVHGTYTITTTSPCFVLRLPTVSLLELVKASPKLASRLQAIKEFRRQQDERTLRVTARVLRVLARQLPETRSVIDELECKLMFEES